MSYSRNQLPRAGELAAGEPREVTESLVIDAVREVDPVSGKERAVAVQPPVVASSNAPIGARPNANVVTRARPAAANVAHAAHASSSGPSVTSSLDLPSAELMSVDVSSIDEPLDEALARGTHSLLVEPNNLPNGRSLSEGGNETRVASPAGKVRTPQPKSGTNPPKLAAGSSAGAGAHSGAVPSPLGASGSAQGASAGGASAAPGSDAASARARSAGGTQPPPIRKEKYDPEGDGNIGLTLGSYRVLEQLGKGGMGYVYRAEHIKLGREVALKLLRADYSKRRDAVGRFFQEARTVNRVRHRNIVDVTDFVELDDGTTFIIMEFLRGTSLGRWSRRGIELPRALAILVQICDGLAAAHAVGVVHRDLKPDNIFVEPMPDGTEIAKLLDFGVAKLLNRDDDDFGVQTAAGSVIGTPAYMSPEQAGGSAIDGRSDIYSLGAIMYELFTGQTMFKGKSFGEYVRKHLTEMPPAPHLTPGGATIDPRVESIIMCCLEKDPARRFANVGDMRDALLSVLAGFETQPPMPYAALSRPGHSTADRSARFEKSASSGAGHAAAASSASGGMPALPLAVAPYSQARSGPVARTAAPSAPQPLAAYAPSAGIAKPESSMSVAPGAVALPGVMPFAGAAGAPPSPAVAVPAAAPAGTGLSAASIRSASLPTVVPASMMPQVAHDSDTMHLSHSALVSANASQGYSVEAVLAAHTGAGAVALGTVPVPSTRPHFWLKVTLGAALLGAALGGIIYVMAGTGGTKHAEMKVSAAPGSATLAAATSPTGGPEAIEVRFESQPAARVVASDGTERCTTPCSARVDVGNGAKREFVLRADGYSDAMILVDVGPTGRREYAVNLQPLPSGSAARNDGAASGNASGSSTLPSTDPANAGPLGSPPAAAANPLDGTKRSDGSGRSRRRDKVDRTKPPEKVERVTVEVKPEAPVVPPAVKPDPPKEPKETKVPVKTINPSDTINPF